MLHKSTKLIVVLFALVLALVPGMLTARAAATISSWGLTCSSLHVSGTSDQPYVALRMYVGNTTDIDGLAIGGAPRIFDAWLTGAPTFPVSGGTYSFSISFPAEPLGTSISFRVFGATNSDGHNWDLTPQFVSIAVASCASGTFSGPPIPNGFVLRTIVCNVAVYDTAGGKPVGSNAVTSGQTWYVNPTPKTGPDGRAWTEIFVAGYSNGFIPTNCVR